MGGSAQRQNFSNVLNQSPATQQGGQFAPVTPQNAYQSFQQAQGNPAAMWSLPMRAMFGMIAQPPPSQNQPMPQHMSQSMPQPMPQQPVFQHMPQSVSQPMPTSSWQGRIPSLSQSMPFGGGISSLSQGLPFGRVPSITGQLGSGMQMPGANTSTPSHALGA